MTGAKKPKVLWNLTSLPEKFYETFMKINTYF